MTHPESCPRMNPPNPFKQLDADILDITHRTNLLPGRAVIRKEDIWVTHHGNEFFVQLLRAFIVGQVSLERMSSHVRCESGQFSHQSICD